jgi:DNA (cytosine-5)-methyltransferase 1
MKHLGLFEGIGGFSLAARWAGWQTVAWCEWDDFGQKILSYHFPNAEKHGDITKSDFTKYRGKVDIITGGFPCQPYSVAGKRLGTDDERHLWPEMLRAIREVQPRWVVGENVSGIVNWNGGVVFEQVHIDLENEGYEVQAFVLPACAVNAPHRRDRVWFVAYKNTVRNGRTSNKRKEESCIRGFRDVSAGNNERICANDDEVGNAANPDSSTKGSSGKSTEANTKRSRYAEQQKKRREKAKQRVGRGYVLQNAANPDNQGLQRSENVGGFNPIWTREKQQPTRLFQSDWENFPNQSPICGRNDGLPTKLDGITLPKWRTETVKAYGNAIVPQVAYQIFKAINEYESQMDNRTV